MSGFHLFPFRTEKLSPSAPMVLHTRGRVGSRRFSEERVLWNSRGLFFSIDYRVQSTDYRVQITEYRVQIIDERWIMTLRVGTLRAASALFAVFGCCPQRHIVLCLLFCVLRTQHAASLHAHMLCFCSLLYDVYPLLCPLRLGKFWANIHLH